MVYCIASLVLSHASIVFFLLMDMFLLCMFWADKLCDTVLLAFFGLVFEFYKYLLI
jgi:hypothetical protein